MWLTIKRKILCFPVGIVNVLITAWLVFEQKLYADTLQQLVYFFLLLAGWVLWSRNKSKSDDKIFFLSATEIIVLSTIWISSSLLMGYFLKNYTDAAFPFWDSIATAICFIAQWLIAKRKIENWILWMMANIMYIVIYYLKELPLYSVLSLVYLVMAIFGWVGWRKKLKQVHH